LLGGIFDLDTMKVEIKALEAQMSDKDFWQDQEQAKKVSKQVADFKQEVNQWELLKKEVKELEELAYVTNEEDALANEIKQKMFDLLERFSKMEFAMLFSGTHDQRNAIISIHAGSGGTEAQDWAQMLLRMILRFCEKQGWQTTILWQSEGQEVGIKSVTLRVQGYYAYGYLRSEAGVHRLVRISPFDADKARHTSFALIEVLPELEQTDEIQINPHDLRIDTFRSGGAGGQSVNKTSSAVRIVHEPTGITVVCQNERSQQQNRETAMKILVSRLHQLQQTHDEQEKQKLRGEFKSAAWGNQIRSYVLQPYQMVKDHRTDYESSDTSSVLDGDLERFMEAYLRLELNQSERLAKENQEINS